MKKIILSLLVIASYSHAMNNQCVIKPFDKNTDKQFVFDLLDTEQNKIMIAGNATDDAKAVICDPSQCTTHILLKNNDPVGFISFSIDQSSCCCLRPPKGKIDLLAIAPQHRKQGHAKRLIQHAIKELTQEPIDEIGLYVNRDNTEAIALYKKLNFKQYQLIPSIFFHYYALHSWHNHQE